jgi:hypothetical protein
MAANPLQMVSPSAILNMEVQAILNMEVQTRHIVIACVQIALYIAATRLQILGLTVLSRISISIVLYRRTNPSQGLAHLDVIKYQHALHAFWNQDHMIRVFHIIMRLFPCHCNFQLRYNPGYHNSNIIRRQKFAYAFASTLSPQHHSVLHGRGPVRATRFEPSCWVEFVWIRKHVWVPLRHKRRNTNNNLIKKVRIATSDWMVRAHISGYKDPVDNCTARRRNSWHSAHGRWMKT